MYLIECTLGAATLHVNGTTYDFSRDQHGRYVSKVINLLDRSLFLSVAHYREVPEVLEEAKPKRSRASAPSEQGPASTGEPPAGEQPPQGGEPDGPPRETTTGESAHGEANAPDEKPKGRGGRKPKAEPEA